MITKDAPIYGPPGERLDSKEGIVDKEAEDGIYREQDCSISSALAMEILQSSTKPSMYFISYVNGYSLIKMTFTVLCIAPKQFG